jgi:eukaryotic-like serine/threonine-protein kinase
MPAPGVDGARIAMPASFRYVHEPLVEEPGPIPLLGHRAMIEQLTDQLRHSDGGTLLISGFRGVGKTTVVQRALRDLTGALADARVVTITLNVARSMSTSELLFAVVRRLFEVLGEKRWLDDLPDDVQRALLLAYLRTSLQLAQSRTDATERTSGVSLGGSGGGLMGTVLGSLLPKLDLGTKKSSSLAVEASFLTYSDTDVEHDFLSIVEMLGRRELPVVQRRHWWQRPRPAETHPPIRVVVVLDELDKLTATKQGLAAFEKLLGGLKNVLTSAGVHFIFVAGPDIYDIAAMDAARGTGIYESVFSWQGYVPCLWNAPASLLQSFVPEPDDHRGEIAELVGYLSFRSRGIPRRLLQEFNDLVRWIDGTPGLELNPAVRQRASFFARLDRVVVDHLGALSNTTDEPSLDEDRRRLGAYYATEWVLRSEGRVFGVPDIIETTGGPATIDASVRMDARRVAVLLDALELASIVVRVSTASPDRTFIGSARSTESAAFHLADDILAEHESLARASTRDHVPFTTGRDPVDSLSAPIVTVPAAPAYAPRPAPPPPPPSPLASWVEGGPSSWPPGDARVVPSPAWGPAPAPVAPPPVTPPVLQGGTMADGRYRIVGRIGVGAMGTVYAAEDQTDGQEVAIKLIELRSARADPDLRARFRREIDISTSLNHPGLVRSLGSFEEPDGRLGLIMERLHGPTLAEVPTPVEPATVVTWGIKLCDALDYLYQRGIARVDLKPSNIIIVAPGRPVIVDLGLAKRIGLTSVYDTVEPTTIGTPAYMSPEQFSDGRADIRSDLFALGVVLFELLGGAALRPPLDDVLAVFRRTIETDVPVDDLAVSAELRGVLREATARQPDQRFSTPAEMAEALSAVPDAARPPDPPR